MYVSLRVPYCRVIGDMEGTLKPVSRSLLSYDFYSVRSVR